MRGRLQGARVACLALAACAGPLVCAAHARADADADADAGSDADEVGFAPLVPPPAPAEEGETPPPDVDSPEAALTLRRLALAGFVGSELAIRTQHPSLEPLAKARQVVEAAFAYGRGGFQMRLGVHGAYDLAYLDGEPAVERDAYEWLVRPAESYLRGSSDHFAIETGALLHPPGTMRLLDLLDVLSPRDLREPGMLEPGALRLPVFSTQISVFLGPHRLDAGVIHQAFWGLRPAPLGELSILREVIVDYLGIADTPLEAALLSRDVRYDDDVLGVSRHSQQPYARVRFEGTRATTEVLYAHLRDRIGVFSSPIDIDLGSPIIELPVAHPYYDLVGIGGEAVNGDWAFSYEALAEWSRPIATSDAPDSQGAVFDQRLNVFSAAVGLRYEGLPGVTLGAEHRRSCFGWREAHETPLLPYTVPASALYYRHSLSRDRVLLEAALVLFGSRFDAGTLARAHIAYRPVDTLQLGVGYLLYHEGSQYGPLRGFGPSDRAFADLRWDFARAIH